MSETILSSMSSDSSFIVLKELEELEFSPGCFLIHKPEGWSVHNDDPSLHKHLLSKGNPIHFVNRIDQETSGLVLWTTHPERVDPLQKTLALTESRKIYRALTPKQRIHLPASWTWDQALTPHAEGRKNPFGIANQRVPAHSEVRLISQTQWFSDLEVTLHSGRQHQIRKHCAGNDLPIIGDSRYGRAGLNEKIKQTYNENRLFLHAWRLQFPYKGENYLVEAELPASFTKLMAPSEKIKTNI
jgi:tRNA pseudouridine65 synthase